MIEDFMSKAPGIILVMVGVYSIFNPDKLSRAAIEQRKRINRILHIRMQYNDTTKQSTSIMYVFVGFVFILFGILSILGIIKFL